MKKFIIAILALFSFAFFLTVPRLAQAANSIFSGSLVFDDFDFLHLRPNPQAYWYILNWGDGQVFSDFYGPSSSVTAENEGEITFARLAIHPDATPGDYSNAEIAERNTGSASQEPGQWSPDFNHPVVFENRVRWSPQYKADASGSAVGTNGIWLWNSPIVGEVYGPTKAFGFNWSMSGTGFNLVGLSATVVRGTIPVVVYRQQITNVDMNDWVDLKVVWSRHTFETEKLEFYVNNSLIGISITPSLGKLTVETWNDNQLSSFAGRSFPNPASDQMMDIDFIRVERL